MMKILVINLMHVGDLLLVTPVLRTLRTNYPEAHIALLADSKLRDLVRLNKNIDELIEIDKKGYHNSLINYLRFVFAIRRRRFDLVINLHANERASFIAAFSGGKKVVGYASFGLGILYDFCMKNRKAVKHQVHSHFDLLKEGLGIKRMDDRGIEMWLDEESLASADQLWAKAFSNCHGEHSEAICPPVIGLNIGASWPTKRWPKEYYAELADRLLEKGYGIAYLGGPMDEEIVQEAISLMKHKDSPHIGVFTGRMTLMELETVQKKCTALVTNDSGPMHVATAMNVPLVSIFGPSPVTGFYPYNKTSIVVKTPIHCHPCFRHHCDTLECMYAITVDEILERTLAMVEKGMYHANCPY